MEQNHKTLRDSVASSQHRGDPLADAVIAEFDGHPDLPRAWINQGITQGRASLPGCPPSLDALLRQAELAPPGVDPRYAARGSDAWLSVPSFWLTVALGPGSLTHTYTAPAIAEVLVKTQNLQARTVRRLAETAAWSHQVVRPGGLLPGAPGYVHTLQVRLLHARVRAAVTRGGAWQTARGVPISQCDLLRTWLDFTFVPFGALEKLGFAFSDDELAHLYAMWQGVAHLLGVEPQLYGGIGSQAQAQAVLDAIDADLPAPGADARALTHSMLESVGGLTQPALQVPVEVSVGLMQALCRHIHGDALSDALQVPRSWTTALLADLVDANRYRRLQEAASPAARQQRIAQTLQEFDYADGQLHGDTTYQAHASQLPAGEIPRTPSQPAAVAG